MRIRWYGHSCFEFKDAVTVITDPHDGKSIGIPVPNLSGDLVLVSHDHFDHNCVRIVKGQEVSVINEPVMTVECGIRIHGIETFHDSCGGAKRGRNIVFCFELDGVQFCHLGDLGHMLESDQLSALPRIDVLMVPAGNIFTLDVANAVKLSRTIAPKVIIPMHYRIGGLSLSIRPVDDFLSFFSEDEILRVGSEVEFKPEDLSEDGIFVWVFSL